MPPQQAQCLPAHLQEAYQLLPIPIAFVSRSGAVLWGNQVWRQQMPEVQGAGLAACLSAAQLLSEALSQQQATSFAADLIGLGSAKSMQLHLTPYGQGSLLLLQDLSGANDELRQKCNTLQTIVDANADCIKVLDLNDRLLSMNVGGMKVMEVDDFQACLNAAWPSFWQDADRPEVDLALQQAKDGGVGRFEGFCPTMKGTPKWWEVTLSPIRDLQGQVTNILSTSRDITKRKQDEYELLSLTSTLEKRVMARTKELDLTIEQLRKSNAELERFAYIAAHDLQEPLRTVTSFTEMLYERYAEKLDDAGRQYLRFIDTGARRLKTLVTDLLLFSRLNHEAPQRTLMGAQVPLQEALKRLETRLTDADIHLARLPQVYADGPQLAQIFQSLLDNALKFKHPSRKLEISITGRQVQGGVELCLADNGVGVAPEYQEKVFEMFERLHSRDEYEGTGLGLSICQKIIEAHGGRIWLSSVLHEGSRVYLYLPHADASRQADLRAAPHVGI